MEWVQVFTIIGVLGGFGFFMLQRIEKDMDKIKETVEGLGHRINGHAFRVDQLYRIFVDLLKERK